MIAKEEFIENYWNYYLLLEEKFLNTLNYVELCESNFDTYSKEYMSQIHTIGAEIDTVFKVICGFNQKENKKIYDYLEYIKKNDEEILEIKVKIKETRFEIIPFRDTTKNGETLRWWNAYNRLKHGRALNKKYGNMKNTLYMLAAIYILEMYYIKKISKSKDEMDIPNNMSKLFDLGEKWTRYIKADSLNLKVIEEW